MTFRNPRRKRKSRRHVVTESDTYDFSIVTDIGIDHLTELNQVQFLALFGLGPAKVESMNVVLVSMSYSVSHLVETTCLKKKFRVELTQLREAHWVLSWRVGVLHVPHTNLFHKYRRRQLWKMVQELSEKFQKPVVIVSKGHSTTSSMEQRANERIMILTSSSPQETAAHLVSLAREETDNGHGLYGFSTQEIATKIFQYYYDLPGINILVALRLCRKFPYLSLFRKSCNTVGAIQAETGISATLATVLLSKLK